MGISVVLLAYKEAENLKILFPRIIKSLKETGQDYEIILIDTKETLDETPQICKQFNVSYINQEEEHYGGAFRTGIKYASKDQMLVLDCDGSHSPEAIVNIYDKYQEGYDLVIGSRYCKGGKTKDSFGSFVMSKILNTVMRIIIGVKAKDISTSYRMYNTFQLKSIFLKCEHYDVLQEVILKLRLNNKKFRIGEVPIVFEKRIYGESKRQLLKFIRNYLKTLFRLLFMRIKGRDKDVSGNKKIQF
ncbi:MAG TPA: glycosyltransferase [Clostridiaceae bacterium]